MGYERATTVVETQQRGECFLLHDALYANAVYAIIIRFVSMSVHLFVTLKLFPFFRIKD